jgi:6-carboxyhexanoate--CoA ligase
MNKLWGIRMRASRKVKSQKLKVKSKKTRMNEIHISGAEGLYGAADVQKVVNNYIKRAINHSKGKPDKIMITVEEIKQKPREISALPITTVRCSRPAEGERIVINLLRSLGISKKAINTAFKLIKKGEMRGAVVITTEKGKRLEPDKERGVRASRLGIDKPALKLLSFRLSRYKINTDTVKEAVILASKVASHRDVEAELCMSDDPNYTTGYIASKKFGYVRVPNIKQGGSISGGRAFFVREGTNTERLIHYLERTPVLITECAPCRGIISIDEILNCLNI